MNVQQAPQLPDFAGILRRRSKPAAMAAGVVFLVMYWIAMALPNQFSSYATILVEPQAIADELVRAGVRQSDLKERLGIMTAEILSRSRLSRLIDELDLYPEESKRLQRQEVIDIMRSQLNVVPVLSELELKQRNAFREVQFNTFKISFSAKLAQTAALVTQSLANDFIEANISSRVEVSQQSLDFMDGSIAALMQRIREVEQEIRKIKSENSGRLPDDLSTNQRIFQTTIGQLREMHRNLNLAESDEAFWKNQVLTAATMTNYSDQMSPGYRKKTVEAELGMMQARGFTDRHPDVLRAKQELDLLEEMLKSSVDPDEEEVAHTFAEQNARSELRRSTLKAEAVKRDLERLEAQRVEVEERIGATPSVALRLESLEREYQHLGTSFQDFSSRREQANVQADMERKQLGEQFRILESAFPAPRPTSPNRPLILILGILIGGGVGGAIGLLLETADSSVHGSRDLQVATDIPVLASIPAIMLAPDLAARSRRLIREIVIASVIGLMGLIGGGLAYFYVNGFPSILVQADEEASEVENEDQAFLGIKDFHLS
jgi:polysaccharide chain length determinant protein (PEP-CTERM system associated)